jgi:hypothetical protein
MTTHHRLSTGEEHMSTESSEKGSRIGDVSNTANAEKAGKEQGMMADQDTVADEGNAVVEKKVDVPPNGGYGWVCVAACATINAYVNSRIVITFIHG